MNRLIHKELIVRLFALLILLTVKPSEAEAQTDSLYMLIDSTTVVSERHSSALRLASGQIMKIDMDMIQNLPKILGNTDPLHFVKLLPGVQTNSEQDSGIHIQGCDAAHNEMSVGGVPVFGVNHMLGLFSIFNPEHYSQMSFSHNSTFNRLGGMLRMELPDTLKKKVEGAVSVGIMSSQGSIGLRIKEKSHLKVSARQSYMNLLYGRWMTLNGTRIKYGFGDYNLTYIWDSGKGDRVWLDGYLGMDRAGMDEKSYDIGLSIKWGNYLGAAHWKHTGDILNHYHSLYSSGYMSDVFVSQSNAIVQLPTFINAAGYKGGLSWERLQARWESVYYRAMPQLPQIHGMFNSTEPQKEIQNALENTLALDYDYEFASDWNLKAGLKGTLLYNPEAQLDWGLAPALSLSYNARRLGKFALDYRWQEQYIFQTGLSNVGFPIEFWFVAGKHSPAQYSQNISFAYDVKFCRDMFALSCNLYYKQLYNQVEYKGDLFDFFLQEYNLDDCLLKGRGWNYGANVMLHKQSGAVTGWVAYSVGRALRKFNDPEYTGIYPANHERIHELNAVCSYDWRRWNFSSTFIYASGQPFTAPGSYYISSGKIIANYGERNACRMRPYIRLDLSATWTIKKDENQENGLNFSVYNVLGRRNDVIYRLRVNDENQFAYSRMSFGLRFVPSISYYHKF